MSLKVPDYVKKNEKGRYVCSKCGNFVAAFVVDLGCDRCDGKGVSSDYIEIQDRIEQVIHDLQTDGNSLTADEKERLLDNIKGELFER